MEVYISELDIETYRGIKNLKMENLAPINIITGDNNSGKTSVLELLQSVKNPGSFRVWRELLRKDSSISYFLSRNLVKKFMTYTILFIICNKTW